MKTHKVVDVINHSEAALFYGTEKECYEWTRDQGLGYKITSLTKEEYILANNLQEK